MKIDICLTNVSGKLRKELKGFCDIRNLEYMETWILRRIIIRIDKYPDMYIKTIASIIEDFN